MVNIKNLTPATAIHPGEILKDELEERGITQKEFALLIDIQPSQLNELIKGKRGINTELALLIGKALKMEPQTWINLQSNYEMDLLKMNKRTKDRLKAIEQWHNREG